MNDRNYGVTNKIAECLDDLKIFNACRCSNPREGKILVEYENDYFFIKISPFVLNERNQPKNFEDAVKKFHFIVESSEE